VALIAVSHGVVLLQVPMSVAGGYIEVNVAEYRVEHAGGYRLNICIIWWSRWYLWRHDDAADDSIQCRYWIVVWMTLRHGL